MRKLPQVSFEHRFILHSAVMVSVDIYGILVLQVLQVGDPFLSERHFVRYHLRFQR
jgi:hypothetical protein